MVEKNRWHKLNNWRIFINFLCQLGMQMMGIQASCLDEGEILSPEHSWNPKFALFVLHILFAFLLNLYPPPPVPGGHI